MNTKIVLGNGMLAKEIEMNGKSDGAFFASGVSNSICVDLSEFNREISLLKNFINAQKGNKLIYFSSFSVLTDKSSYADHKRNIENLIKQSCDNYLIVRLPQVVGITKNNTLVNFFVKNILEDKKVIIQRNATRRLIGVKDVIRIIDLLITKFTVEPKTINIGPKSIMSVKEIVDIISFEMGKEPVYELVDNGSPQNVKLDEIMSIIPKTDKLRNEDYQLNLLKEYVPKLVRQNIKNLK